MLTTLVFPEADLDFSGTVQITVHTSPPARRVSFYVDGTLKASATVAPFVWNLDTTIFADGVHEIRAVATHKNGKVSSDSESVTFSNEDPEPPADVTAPTVAGSFAESADTVDSITVTWTAATDAVGVAGYNLYLNNVQVAKADPDVTTHVFTGLQCGKTYTLGIQAYDAAGNKSAIVSISAATEDCPAPPPDPDDAVYLSDLTWTYSVNGWGPVEKDKSNGEQLAGDGTTITLNGVTYTKGLGVHAFSEIRYTLNSQYVRFKSDVGIDDEVAEFGSVVFEVWGDGVKKYGSPVMRSDTATASIDIDVTGVNELRLICNDAGDGINHDHGDWASARIIVNPNPPPPTPPPATSRVLKFPASGHVWGGNSGTAMATHDIVISSDASQGNPKAARAAGNTNLIAFQACALDPWNSDWTKRKTFAFTYGGGLTTWTGGTDNLQPLPLGTLRAWQTTDYGCTQADGIRGYALWQAATAEFLRRAIWYSWKLGKGYENEWDGVWSDNLVPGNILNAGWFYGTCASDPARRAAWDVGLINMLKNGTNGVRDLGIPFAGGNTAHRATNNTLRAAINCAMHEVLEQTIAQGAASFASLLSEVQAWQNAASGNRYFVVMDRTPSTNAARMKFGLALTCILGGAYLPYYNSHSDLYLPAEMKNAGNRHYLGVPTAAATRSGNTWSRAFENGTVSANYDTQVGTITVA